MGVERHEAMTGPFSTEPTHVAVDDLNRMLRWAYDAGASDLYFGAGMPVMVAIHGHKEAVVRRRISGTEVGNVLNAIYGANGTAILSGGESLSFSYEIASTERGVRCRFRVNAAGCVEGMGTGFRTVFRAIPHVLPQIGRLELEPVLIESLFPDHGLVLVTGKTGSGKSTLLAAVIRQILETQDKAIYTYEAPVEFVYRDLSRIRGFIFQSEIPRHLKSFPEAVRDSLRNAPDVVLFGEARDRETIQGSVEEARTGHTVYTTVHTESVAGTFGRILDVFPVEEHEGRKNALFESTRAIVHQRLVPSAHGSGRFALREFLVLDDEIRNRGLATPAPQMTAMLHRFVEERGQPMARAAKRAAAAGVITEESLRRVLADVRTGAQE